MKIQRLLTAILLALSCAAYAQSDEKIELVFENLPLPAEFGDPNSDIWNGIDSPVFYIYRAHPYYQYALASGNKELWSKVESACDIFYGLVSGSCQNLAQFAFLQSIKNCRAEAQQSIASKGTFCPQVTTNSAKSITGNCYSFQGNKIRIRLGAGIGGTLYRISSKFNQAVYNVRTGTQLSDTDKDNVCKVCVLQFAALDGALDGSTSCIDLKNRLGNYADAYSKAKDWSPEQNQGAYGSRNLWGPLISCVRSCRSALTKVAGSFNASACPIKFADIKTYLVINGNEKNQIPFRW